MRVSDAEDEYIYKREYAIIDNKIEKIKIKKIIRYNNFESLSKSEYIIDDLSRDIYDIYTLDEALNQLFYLLDTSLINKKKEVKNKTKKLKKLFMEMEDLTTNIISVNLQKKVLESIKGEK